MIMFTLSKNWREVWPLPVWTTGLAAEADGNVAQLGLESRAQ
jgi:hypothetical protein